MRILPALTLAFVAAVPALAQDDSVIVGGVGGGRTLIDPATGEPRYVPELIQPWQDEAIRLKPPGRVRKTPAATAPTTSYSEPAPVTAPPPPKKKRVAAAPPPPAAAPKPASPPSSISGFADIDLITGTGSQRQTQTAAAPKPVAAPKPAPVVAAPKPAPVVTAPKPTKTASIQLPKTKAPAGNRRDSITFTAGASDPSGSAVSAVRSLASSLGSAMGDNGRVQLMAYAGSRGEKTSDTRRLSLKRALVIRQLLIDDGIPSERIDVFALGGADDDGPLDRVDVFLKS
jgi:outer membrane protein OmpA-like peptidoglycan-associated protein